MEINAEEMVGTVGQRLLPAWIYLKEKADPQ